MKFGSFESYENNSQGAHFFKCGDNGWEASVVLITPEIAEQLAAEFPDAAYSESEIGKYELAVQDGGTKLPIGVLRMMFGDQSVIASPLGSDMLNGLSAEEVEQHLTTLSQDTSLSQGAA